ncbi:MAG TPA: 4'-phosphopantetheinyl transferase superfamily protein [Salinimicrobium sp.]|nr:4'-phosphopantetheinyl transferase superfamily protein [Salinimicrobium sp.]
MIGNDVVDLHLAKKESNWNRPRFLFKIFSKKERLLIASAANKTLMVWRLWTMKEAAYKAHQRRFNLSPKFNPTAFECSLISGENGMVQIGTQSYETYSVKNSGFIYSEAKILGFGRGVYSELKENNSSKNIKTALNYFLSQGTNRPLAQFEIRKDKNGIPWLFTENKKQKIPFSISRHGRFSIFSCSVPFREEVYFNEALTLRP